MAANVNKLEVLTSFDQNKLRDIVKVVRDIPPFVSDEVDESMIERDIDDPDLIQELVHSTKRKISSGAVFGTVIPNTIELPAYAYIDFSAEADEVDFSKESFELEWTGNYSSSDEESSEIKTQQDLKPAQTAVEPKHAENGASNNEDNQALSKKRQKSRSPSRSPEPKVPKVKRETSNSPERNKNCVETSNDSQKPSSKRLLPRSPDHRTSEMEATNFARRNEEGDRTSTQQQLFIHERYTELSMAENITPELITYVDYLPIMPPPMFIRPPLRRPFFPRIPRPNFRGPRTATHKQYRFRPSGPRIFRPILRLPSLPSLSIQPLPPLPKYNNRAIPNFADKENSSTKNVNNNNEQK